MDMEVIILNYMFSIYQMSMVWQSAPQSFTQRLLRRVKPLLHYMHELRLNVSQFRVYL